MERQEDGQVQYRVACRVSLADQWCRPVWPGAPGGPPFGSAHSCLCARMLPGR
jgi:hypothetical protein